MRPVIYHEQTTMYAPWRLVSRSSLAVGGSLSSVVPAASSPRFVSLSASVRCLGFHASSFSSVVPSTDGDDDTLEK